MCYEQFGNPAAEVCIALSFAPEGEQFGASIGEVALFLQEDCRTKAKLRIGRGVGGGAQFGDGAQEIGLDAAGGVAHEQDVGEQNSGIDELCQTDSLDYLAINIIGPALQYYRESTNTVMLAQALALKGYIECWSLVKQHSSFPLCPFWCNAASHAGRQ